jgi:hypothetical protein
MSDMTTIPKRGLTSLDDQNTKQAPVPEIAKKLNIEKMWASLMMRKSLSHVLVVQF